MSPVGQQLYLCALVSLHLAVGLSVPPQALLQVLLCAGLLVFQLLLQLINPDMMNTPNKMNVLYCIITELSLTLE